MTSYLPTYQTVYYQCQECPNLKSPKYEGVEAMVAHILDNHHHYTQAEAERYAQEWADDVINEADQYNWERNQFFKKHGYDKQEDK